MPCLRSTRGNSSRATREKEILRVGVGVGGQLRKDFFFTVWIFVFLVKCSNAVHFCQVSMCYIWQDVLGGHQSTNIAKKKQTKKQKTKILQISLLLFRCEELLSF